ncbi:ATP-binding protein [Streptomyces sp. NRRL WC-3719]|uniref:ATP-binding protein n=1 Tax=Streptomyces sp. NRRL WC-3719 TaxID=1463932 RepID=UPI00068EB590|nr:ATP-binding protein [Streptomyces sp. NRRL WC-3719]
MTRESAAGGPLCADPLYRFSVPLSATRRGARLARLLAAERLREWGAESDAALLVVAELAANAVLHGRVPGRSFRLTLAQSGYGLLLVGELADRWGVRQGPVPCKTVWAELDLDR